MGLQLVSQIGKTKNKNTFSQEGTMEFNFYPWKLDIDVEKTKALYAEKTFAVDEAANRILISKLTKEQRDFLDSLDRKSVV